MCAPSGPVPADRLRAGVDVLSSRYRVRVADSVLAREGYLAGPDEVRAAELNALLRDDDVRAIVMARGGYGAMRILDCLDAAALRASPKLIVGFSDATAILAWALCHAGVRAIHGPMVGQLGALPESDISWLFDLMEQPQPAGRVPISLAAGGAETSADTMSGILAGGNLCMLAHLAGTPYALAIPDLVLLLEEVGERPYRIDRFLTQLGLAGILSSSVAAVVGELSGCHETVHSDHPSASAVLDERLRHFSIPTLTGAPLAHGARNLALPMGARCVVEPRQGALTLLDAAVS